RIDHQRVMQEESTTSTIPSRTKALERMAMNSEIRFRRITNEQNSSMRHGARVLPMWRRQGGKRNIFLAEQPVHGLQVGPILRLNGAASIRMIGHLLRGLYNSLCATSV